MVRLFSWAAAALLASLSASLSAVDAQDFKLYGVNYNIRAGPDWAPQAQKCKGADQIKAELQKLKKVTGIVRLYSLTDCDQANAVVPAVIAAGLKLELGLWVGPDRGSFDAEREKFRELVKNKKLINKKTIASIHVGSEAIYRKDVTADTAIGYFKEIKKICADAKLNVPVSIADIGDTYLQYPNLIQEVDFVSANLFPFWEKVAANKAAAHFYKRYKKVKAAAKQYKKSVVIGETGWASGGKHAGASDASPANSARFFSDFYKLAKKKNLKYYYFAGFDEAWKISNAQADSTVEGYFGIFTAQGELKPELKQLKLDSAPKTAKKNLKAYDSDAYDDAIDEATDVEDDETDDHVDYEVDDEREDAYDDDVDDEREDDEGDDEGEDEFDEEDEYDGEDEADDESKRAKLVVHIRVHKHKASN